MFIKDNDGSLPIFLNSGQRFTPPVLAHGGFYQAEHLNLLPNANLPMILHGKK